MAFQQWDRYLDQPRQIAETEFVMEKNAAHTFLDRYPDFYMGPDDCNFKLIVRLLRHQELPISLRNLEIAMLRLDASGALEKPFDNKHTVTYRPSRRRGTELIASTVKTKFSPLNTAEIQLIAERPERLEEIGGQKLREFTAERTALNQLSPIGQSVTTALKRAYRQSLAQEHNKQGLPKRWAEARALVRLHRPELRFDSAAFNAEVARKVTELSQ